MVKGQDWSLSKEELIFHNMDWKTTTEVDSASEKAIETDLNIQDQLDDLNQFFDVSNEKATKEPPFIENIEKVIVETPPESVDVKAKLPNLKNIVWIYCLPCEQKENTDNFYGDSYTRISYGKKFVFEAIIIETTDLYIKFWTTAKPAVSKGSIIFPWVEKPCEENNFQKTPLGEYRWWKVDNFFEKSGGYLVDAVVSDVQPDFSK